MYQAVALHIISCCLDDASTDRFPPGKKPGIKPATYEVANDLKQFIFIYANQEVNDFIKENIDEWDFVMASTEMNQEHYHFGGDKYF